MSTLTLIRHGQASFMQANYDQLSPLGEQQSAFLGDYWGRRNKPINRVLVGPKKRHQQTFVRFSSTYEAHGHRLPSPEPYPDLDEHQGFRIARAFMPQAAEIDPEIAAVYNNGTMNPRDQLMAVRRVLRLWALDKLNADGVDFSADTGPIDGQRDIEFESFATFTSRINRGIQTLVNGASSGQSIIAFSSGGAMASAVGYVLGLAPEKIIDLNWIVKNTATVEFTFSKDRITLSEFNAIPHLEDSKLHTYV